MAEEEAAFSSMRAMGHGHTGRPRALNGAFTCKRAATQVNRKQSPKPILCATLLTLRLMPGISP